MDLTQKQKTLRFILVFCLLTSSLFSLTHNITHLHQQTELRVIPGYQFLQLNSQEHHHHAENIGDCERCTASGNLVDIALYQSPSFTALEKSLLNFAEAEFQLPQASKQFQSRDPPSLS